MKVADFKKWKQKASAMRKQKYNFLTLCSFFKFSSTWYLIANPYNEDRGGTSLARYIFLDRAKKSSRMNERPHGVSAWALRGPCLYRACTRVHQCDNSWECNDYGIELHYYSILFCCFTLLLFYLTMGNNVKKYSCFSSLGLGDLSP